MPEFLRKVESPGEYGPLRAGFHFDASRGYTALVGPNNSGKSALLQLIYRTLIDDGEFGASRVVLILPDRDYVEATTETGGQTLTNWNNQLAQQLHGQPLSYASVPPSGPVRPQLPRLLLHGDLIAQVTATNELLLRLGLPPFRLTGPQEVRFENIAVHLQGAGLRGVFHILAALTNADVTAVLIDEPELSLEPRLQRALRDILVDASRDKVIVVATHSHLFLNRSDVEANQLVTRSADGTVVRALTDQRELYDVTFDLLGSSTEDLFFPRNYVIVEGASDQVIVERILNLRGVPSPSIKVLSARGIDTMRDAIDSVVRALVPIVVNDSPYAARVVALIDRPQVRNANLQRLRNDLGDRLYELPTPMIEEYVPSVVYERAHRSKEDDLAQLKQASGNFEDERVLKREISNALAAALTKDDLDEIPLLRDAAQRAIDESHS